MERHRERAEGGARRPIPGPSLPVSIVYALITAIRSSISSFRIPSTFAWWLSNAPSIQARQHCNVDMLKNTFVSL